MRELTQNTDLSMHHSVEILYFFLKLMSRARQSVVNCLLFSFLLGKLINAKVNVLREKKKELFLNFCIE